MKGINLNGIDKIIDALKQYEKQIDAQDIEIARKNVTKAIKGANAVNQCNMMANELIVKVNQYSDILKSYIQRLNEVKIAYKNQDESATQTFAQGIQEIRNKKS